ncbi:MAG: hypothetical protein HZB71_03975 [Betaproteobacteria bacterium]|nr:hypothetical protein [Betaproteobacteria bacterium]
MSSGLSPALQRLHGKLTVALMQSLQHSCPFGAPEQMTKALSLVRKAFDSGTVETDDNSSQQALVRFKESGRFTNFIDLKYGCYGLSLKIRSRGEEWSVMADANLLRTLLEEVTRERKNPRRFRKCYQGLMHSYFSYPLFDEGESGNGDNFILLREYLSNQLKIALSASNAPTWLMTLKLHDNLLSDLPCKPYAADLLNGNKASLALAAEDIGIGTNSWVWQEAILSSVRAVCTQADDAEFRDRVNAMLNLICSNAEVRLSKSVIQENLGMILVRYAACTDKPEHHRLRDRAVEHIGNPWLRRADWDARVRNDQARKMVDGWLKRRLITDFFALLSEDGAADPRRLHYWIRFEPVIEDMWFALGSHARTKTSSEFQEMRNRMQGRLHHLSGQGSPFNNAFLMKVGHFLIVEFGVTGNATYIFNIEDSRIDFEKREMSTYSLKGNNHVGRLLHMHDWESAFDSWLCPRIGWRPDISNQKKTRAAPVLQREAVSRNQDKAQFVRHSWQRPPNEMDQVVELITKMKLQFDDNRHKGGPLWILSDNTNANLNKKMFEFGFRYAPGKGWWRR